MNGDGAGLQGVESHKSLLPGSSLAFQGRLLSCEANKVKWVVWKVCKNY